MCLVVVGGGSIYEGVQGTTTAMVIACRLGAKLSGDIIALGRLALRSS